MNEIMKELRLKRETSSEDEDWNLNIIQHVQQQNWQPSGGNDLLKITTSSKHFRLSPRVTQSLLELLLFLHERQANKIPSGLLKIQLNGFVVADNDADDDNSSSCWNQFWNKAIQLVDVLLQHSLLCSEIKSIDFVQDSLPSVNNMIPPDVDKTRKSLKSPQRKSCRSSYWARLRSEEIQRLPLPRNAVFWL